MPDVSTVSVADVHKSFSIYDINNSFSVKINIRYTNYPYIIIH